MKPTNSVLIAVDDDIEAIRQLTVAVRAHYVVRGTADSRRALDWLEKDKKDKSVAVIVVDQMLRCGPGVDLLENARELRPDVRRVLITKYLDVSVLVQGLHSGAINRMISKPLLHGELQTVLTPDAMRQISAA